MAGLHALRLPRRNGPPRPLERQRKTQGRIVRGKERRWGGEGSGAGGVGAGGNDVSFRMFLFFYINNFGLFYWRNQNEAARTGCLRATNAVRVCVGVVHVRVSASVRHLN